MSDYPYNDITGHEHYTHCYISYGQVFPPGSVTDEVKVLQNDITFGYYENIDMTSLVLSM